MILAVLLLALAPGRGQAEGELLAAWKASEGAASEVVRTRERAALLLRAGAPEAAYEEARRGLRSNAHDATLLFHEVTAAVWLGDGARAQEAAQRLLARVQDEARPLDGREEWEATARRRLEEARALVAKQDALARAIARARALSLTVLGLVSAVVLAWTWRRADPQGRSSNPVS